MPEYISVYSHIGASSEWLTDFTAEGTLRVRPDLRHPGGLLAAPLGIMVLDCAATNTHRLGLSAPTRIDVHVYEPAHDVDELRIRGTVIRNGRTQIFTEARIEDAADPSRVVAFGTTSFAVTGAAAPAGGKYLHAPPPADDGRSLPPLVEAFGGEPEGDGYVLPPLSGATKRLHSGFIQTMAEAAALNAAKRRSGGAAVRIDHLGTTVMTEGRVGPFSVIPEILAIDADSAGCRVEVRDRGSDNRFVSLVSARVRITPA